MALAETATQGIEYVGEIDPNQVFYMPGDPGVTYSKGEAAVFSNGILVAAADSGVPPFFIVQETVICPALATGYPVLSDCVTDGSAIARTLIPVKFMTAGRASIWKANFANHADDTIAEYTAATPSITLTVALGGNDDPNGGVVYIYEGPGAGQWNTIEDYVDSTKIVTLTRAFTVAPTSASKCIILEGEGGGAARGIGFGGRIDLDTVDQLDASDGANDGDFFVLLDGRSAAEYLRRLQLPFIRYAGGAV